MHINESIIEIQITKRKNDDIYYNNKMIHRNYSELDIIISGNKIKGNKNKRKKRKT